MQAVARRIVFIANDWPTGILPLYLRALQTPLATDTAANGSQHSESAAATARGPLVAQSSGANGGDAGAKALDASLEELEALMRPRLATAKVFAQTMLALQVLSVCMLACISFSEARAAREVPETVRLPSAQ